MLSEWISVKERLPTEADADALHCVIAYHPYRGAIVTGWHEVCANSRYTHWVPLPPETPEEIQKAK